MTSGNDKQSLSPMGEGLAREQLLSFLGSVSKVFEQPEIKQRFAVVAKSGGDTLAISKQIQGEVYLQMGIDPKVGLDTITSVRAVFQNDRDCILKYLSFIEREELVREEAALGHEAFQQKREKFQKVQEEQWKLLHQLRKLSADVQEGYFLELQQKLQTLANDDYETLLDFLRIQQQGLEEAYLTL